MVKKRQPVTGVFRHLIYSPRGEIEGVLVEADGAPLQIVFPKHDELAGLSFAALKDGQAVVLEATPAEPSSKGDGEHPVFAYERLVSVDGRKPERSKSAAGPAYRGSVVRLNYARHGAANGVISTAATSFTSSPAAWFG